MLVPRKTDIVIEHIGEARGYLGLANDKTAQQVIRCGGCMADVENEIALDPSFFAVPSKLWALMRKFERGQPIQAYLYEGWENTAIFVEVDRSKFPFDVRTEAMLVPIRQGWLVTAVFRRRLGTFPDFIRSKLLIRQICAYLNYQLIRQTREQATQTLFTA